MEQIGPIMPYQEVVLMGSPTERAEQILISPRQLAARWDVALSWIYYRVEDGSLPHYRVGKYLRFDPAEIDQWLQTQRGGRS
jgi:excisionase family DNA binding protein